MHYEYLYYFLIKASEKQKNYDVTKYFDGADFNL